MAKSLRELKDKVIAVGGKVVQLLHTDVGSPIFRPTVDVDIIVDITSRMEYYAIDGRL